MARTTAATQLAAALTTATVPLADAIRACGFDPNERPRSSRTVSKLLVALGHNEFLVRGRGYWYFAGGNAAGWYSSSVPVYRITDLTLEGWARERDALATDSRNF